MAEITLFTAVKPFSDPDTARHQANALRSWAALSPAVEVWVIGDELGASTAAGEAGVNLEPRVVRTAGGTPTIQSLFQVAREAAPSPLLAFANADILLLDDFLPAVRQAAGIGNEFVLVSRRWDLRVDEEIRIVPGWQQTLRQRVESEARLHPPGGSDVFIFPRSCYRDVPPLAVGRAGWDNWMIFEARRRGWPVIEASGRMTVIHQDHDYRHLPGGRPHYRHPESEANIRWAGGRAAAFTLHDADWCLTSDGLRRRGILERGLWRSWETGLLLRSPKGWRGVIQSLFHPLRAVGVLRGWLAWKLGSARRLPAANKGGRR